MTALTPARPLTSAEVDFLGQLEDTVAAGLHSFIEVGQALMSIRDNRLYRATHSTFEDYCADRWGITDRRARQMIEASQIGTMVPVQNERQARALAQVPEGDRAEVWRDALDRTDGKPTAAAVDAAAKDRRAGSGALPVSGEAEGAANTSAADAGVGAPASAPAPSDADLHAELDAEMAGTAVRFRAQFSAAVAKADDVWQFDVERVAEVYAGDFDREIGPFLAEMRAWCDRVERTHRRLNSGLRVVGE